MKFPFVVLFKGVVPGKTKTKTKVVKGKFSVEAASALDAQLKASRQVKFDERLRDAYFPTYRVTCLEE